MENSVLFVNIVMVHVRTHKSVLKLPILMNVLITGSVILIPLVMRLLLETVPNLLPKMTVQPIVYFGLKICVYLMMGSPH